MRMSGDRQRDQDWALGVQPEAGEPEEARPQRDVAARGRTWRVLAVAVPALVLVAAVAMQDLTAALAVAGLCVVVVGFLALVSSSPSAAGVRSRRGAVAVLAVGGAGMFLGGTAFGAPAVQGQPGGPAMALVAPASKAPATKSAATKPLALTALAALPVKGQAPMTGYQRTDEFGSAWFDVDRNGCDTRNDVLRRDLTDRRETRCKVLAGVLHDPYTGKTIDFVRGERTSSAVQIDHIVPLAAAWRTGAQRLTQAQRAALANDPVNLYAVDGPTNTQKSDGDAATWLPKRKAFRCTYIAHQVAVKRTYGLWVTKAERAAMSRVLQTCPDQRLPAATAAAKASATPKATSSPKASSSAASASGTVTAGAFCSPAGATGRTEAGRAEVCRTSGTDDRLRWRSAA